MGLRFPEYPHSSEAVPTAYVGTGPSMSCTITEIVARKSDLRKVYTLSRGLQ